MKRLVLLTALLAFLVGTATVSQAATVKATGQWAVEFLFSQNYEGNGGAFDFNSDTNTANEGFNIYQRARTQFEFIANESLKGVLQTEIGTGQWGNGAFEFGASAVGIKVRRAYLQFGVPGTKITTVAGYNDVVLPNSGAFGGSNIILDQRMGAVATNIPILDQVGVTMGYGRLFDGDNATKSGTFDAAFLAVPVKLDGVSFTPYFLYGYAGHGALSYIGNDVLTGANSGQHGNLLYGLAAAGNSTLDSRNAYWFGTSFNLDVFDPIKVMADAAYGKTGSGRDRDDRSGWMFDLAVDYTGFDFMTPEVFFVYTSGEDGNSSKNSGKSERMPLLSTYNWAPGSFFYGEDTLLAGSPGFDSRHLGFWALGLSLKDISFVEKLKHTLTIMYMQGTNDKDFVNQQNDGIQMYAFGKTLTDKDSLVEIDLNNSYQIYDQLMATMDFGWIVNNYDKDTWSKSGQAYGTDDAFKLSVGMAYSF